MHLSAQACRILIWCLEPDTVSKLGLQAKHEWFDGIFDKKDPTWCAWAQAFLDAMEELHAYVGKYHKEEMAWGAVKNKSRSMT